MCASEGTALKRGNRIQGLTTHGSSIHRSKRISKKNSESRGSVFSSQTPLPFQSLYELHPILKEYLERELYYIEPPTGDERWDDDRIPRRRYEQEETFYLGIIERAFGSIDFAWPQYLNYINRWGVVAGPYWRFSDRNILDERWEALSEEQQVSFENEIMRYIRLDKVYPKRGTRKWHTIRMLQSWIVDIFNRRILQDEELKSAAIEATNKGLRKRKCKICGTEFQRLQLSVYLPSRFLDIDGCCWGCPLLESTEEQLSDLMRQLVDLCGFIPETGLSFENRSFFARIPDRKLIEVARVYRELGGFPYISDKYGSWIRALLLSGVLGDRGRITPRGIVCIANDGDVCNSLGELEIDNWLSRHKLPHIKEPKYPVHPQLNPRGLKRADWKVGDWYIEYFGLAGDEKYDKKTADKVRLVEDLGLKLIPIATKDLGHLNDILGDLL